MFVGVAGLAFTRYLTRWHASDLFKLSLGATAPLVLLLGYFWAAGALNDIYQWTIQSTLAFRGGRALQSVAEAPFRQPLRIAYMLSWPERLYFCLAAVGIASALLGLFRAAVQGKASALRHDAPRHAVLVGVLVYLAFCMVDFQGRADLIPALPFVGMFGGLVLTSVLDLTTRRMCQAWAGGARESLAQWGFAAISGIVFLGSVVVPWFDNPDRQLRLQAPNLQYQETEIRRIMGHVEEGDEIFAHDAAGILFLAGMSNASRYIYLNRQTGQFLDRIEPGGFSGWFERLKAKRPKLVILGRRPIDRREQFAAWLDAEYIPQQSSGFVWYVRRDAPLNERPR